MQVFRTANEMRFYRDSLDPSWSVGFVPTMGGLHDGHLELVHAARADNICIVSIYINEKQFAPGEDLATYPVTRSRDLAHLRALRVDAVFLPREHEVYPDTFFTHVYPAAGHPARNAFSEGASRPTFFRGVATVLLNLLALVRPTRLYCGQKDAQQCAVIRAIVDDLWLRVAVVVLPTVREFDGLAMSSRNAYLTSVERQYASVLFHAMQAAQEAFEDGERDAARLRAVARHYVEHVWEHPLEVEFKLAYVSVCDRDSFEEIEGAVAEDGNAILCIAGNMGRARLIDNCELRVGGLEATRAAISGRANSSEEGEEGVR